MLFGRVLILKEGPMTSEELFLNYIEKHKLPFELFESHHCTRIVNTFVSTFKFLCRIGGRIPCPVIGISIHPFTGPQSIVPFREGRRIVLQTLLINPNESNRSLLAHQEICECDEFESVLTFACHELRHALQISRVVKLTHDETWLALQRDRIPSPGYRYLDHLVHNRANRRKHAARSFPLGTPSWKIRYHARKELDADATAIACVALYRQTRSLRSIIPILYESTHSSVDR